MEGENRPPCSFFNLPLLLLSFFGFAEAQYVVVFSTMTTTTPDTKITRSEIPIGFPRTPIAIPKAPKAQPAGFTSALT